jgi:hypothetical protein
MMAMMATRYAAKESDAIALLPHGPSGAILDACG